MNLNNILNKPYKHGFILKNNKYYKLYHNFINLIKNNKLIHIYKITKIQLKNIYKKTKLNLYNSFMLFKELLNRVDVFLLKIGICRTINQSRYLISYGKLLINNFLIKNHNFKIRRGNIIKISPFLYNKILKNNIYILKKYLLCLPITKYNKQYTNLNIIVNINTYTIYVK
uniref:Ribosomal protein S4 n=1 Tax=Hepatozoon canis TaxID=110120 RepID=A0A3Q8TKM5_9APIC|nr:ribosomal protein S4 [Hepatozoon canis]